MRWLTEDATLVCQHQNGVVQIVRSQGFVTVRGRAVLVYNDPEGKVIKGCPNVGVGIKPCQTTLVAKQGYSTWLRIGGRRVCLDNVTGLTDGTPPGIVEYVVRSPGQEFVTDRTG